MPTNNLFSITFPETWKETSVYTFEGPDDSGMQHNMVICAVPGIAKDTSVKRFAQDQIAVSAQTMPAFELISENEIIMPDGTTMYTVVYKYTPAEGVTYYQKQHFIIKDKKAWIFTGTFSKKTLQTIANEFDQIVATFRTISTTEDQE